MYQEPHENAFIPEGSKYTSYFDLELAQKGITRSAEDRSPENRGDNEAKTEHFHEPFPAISIGTAGCLLLKITRVPYLMINAT